MKKLLSALMGFILVFALASAAYADDTVVSDMDGLTSAIAAAEPGDTITLAPGTYSPNRGVLTVNKAVNLAADGEVVFNGSIVFDLEGTSQGSRVSVRGINFNAVSGQDCAVILSSGRGWTLSSIDCDYNGWRCGVAVYPDCRSCTVYVNGGDFDTFCDVSVAAVHGNSVQGLYPDKSGLFGYHKYDTGDENAYFYEYDAAGTAYSDADYTPSGEITAEAPYAARVGDHFYSSLSAAAQRAVSGDTIYALRGGDNRDTVTVRSGVTLDIREGESFGETIENHGVVVNRGSVAGVTGEGEARSLVRVADMPDGLSLTVTDTAGREYSPEQGTHDYLLPAGSYIFTFAGESWYTSSQNVTVTSERGHTVTPNANPRMSFSDVSSADWFYDDVFHVCSNGLMDGVSETAFNPNGTVTRAMAVTIIYRLAGEPDMPEADWGYPYADVDADSWYAVPVYWARMNDIVNGTGENTFSPDDPVTREQLAAMLYRYAEFSGAELGNEGGKGMFDDEGSVSAWAKDAIGWAVERGILTGTAERTLSPQGQATRAQLAAMLVRAEEVL